MKDPAFLCSVLCVAVSGSEQLHAKLGSREALRAVERCLKRIERTVEAGGGRVIKTAGDQLLAEFELADRAFQASIEMQQRVADLPPVSGVKLALCVGFAQGPVSIEDGAVFGESVDAAARLAGLARTGQVLINAQAHAALSPALRNMTRGPGLAGARERSSGTPVFELFSLDSSSALSNPDKSGKDGLPDTRLMLRYSGKVILLEERNPLIRLGREDDSDVLIHGRRVSRNHARIERRGKCFVITDTSANGTYVTLNDGTESFLHGQECVLHGRGVLSFAAPASSPDADCAEFELL